MSVRKFKVEISVDLGPSDSSFVHNSLLVVFAHGRERENSGPSSSYEGTNSSSGLHS